MCSSHGHPSVELLAPISSHSWSLSEADNSPNTPGHPLTSISQTRVLLTDGSCILGTEHLQEPLHGAGVDIGRFHTEVPKGQHALLPCRELHHCGDRRSQTSPRPWQQAGDSCPLSGMVPHCPAMPTRGHRFHTASGAAQRIPSAVSLPSAAEVAAPARSSVSWHTISSTCDSRSSLSRAYISWHRRGPKVPSFCKAQPNQGLQ